MIHVGPAICTIALVVVLLLSHPGRILAAPQASQDVNTNSQITFNKDIAPLFFQHCATCHRPGESGPFPLLSYKDAKSHARQIAAVTQSRFMPPWLPEPGEFKFADELRLSDAQIATIAHWVEQGALEGAPSDLPPTPKFAEGWQMGTPDLVIKAEKPYQLPASGTDQYWNFIFRTPVNRTRWLKAIEIRPGDKRVVHHANVLVDRMQSARAQEPSPGAGFGGMEIKIESEAFDPDSHFLFWKPGTAPYTEPDDMALRLDAGTDLVLNIHLQPSGRAEWIQPSLGLYFIEQPATRFPMLLQLENDRKLDIPPGDKNFLVTDEFTLPEDVQLLAIYPHAHYVGKDLQAFAKFPDGTQKSLIRIPSWDLNWQAVFRYETPVDLPAGTVISMRYRYDNSDENIRNPNVPPKRVVGGNRASDEMAHLWLQVLPGSNPGNTGDPRRILQEALARHNVDKNPADFEAHYNLGAMLQGRGDIAGAEKQYAMALSIRPEDATVNNAIAGANLAAGHPDAAVAYLQTALRSRPDYFDAHYNLGTALAMQNDFAAAVEEFRAAVRLNPQDANAEANLGAALAELGNWKEARAHLEKALAIDPTLANARDNLEQVKRGLSNDPQ
ncbi:MAG TPA: tetratricopeptide repeat protein [Candidatus Acidoferrum sp.]|jgi:tetratricopeptide (TPR) repeat protein|nr:tetratricopeptide repeat protein [Candidatus Acidoferrum sp.]